jgi:hypothetical protein
MINQSRRKLIKTLGYGIALTAGGASTLAIASDSTSDLTNKALQTSVLPTCDISICQQQSNGKEIISLMNLTDKSVTLDSITPVGLEHVNGSLVVKLNNVSDHVRNGVITIIPGERFAFEVEAISEVQKYNELQVPNVLAGHLKISSDHPAFNGIIPVTVFDSQAA